jgi:hypothetical protein
VKLKAIVVERETFLGANVCAFAFTGPAFAVRSED